MKKRLFNIVKELKVNDRYKIDDIHIGRYKGYGFDYKGANIIVLQNRYLPFIYSLMVSCGAFVLPRITARKTALRFIHDAIDMIKNPMKPLELIIGGQMSGNRYGELKKEWELYCKQKGEL